jgi:hypothetical protein
VNSEKKKVTILICLFFAVICIGAFQLMGHRRPPPAPDPKKPNSSGLSNLTITVASTQSAHADASGPIKNPQFANDLPERDPFAPPADALPKDASTTAASKPADAPTPFPAQKRHTEGFKPFDPLPAAGAISPVHGAPGSQPHSSQLRLVGVIRGFRPMALFSDDSGNQKLVPLGGRIDGDTRLTGIGEGSAFIDFRGQRRRLTMGGNPVGK